MGKIRNFLSSFVLFLWGAFAIVGVVCAKVFSVPLKNAAVVFLVYAILALVFNRNWIIRQVETFKSGQVKMGTFALVLFCCTFAGFAAPFVQDQITSLVIRPATGYRTSDTNGLIRLFSANETNFFAITTNLDFVFSLPNGVFTGLTQSRITTNINDTATRGTNAFKSGILLSTNGVVPL
jgi:hypothetical protein